MPWNSTTQRLHCLEEKERTSQHSNSNPARLPLCSPPAAQLPCEWVGEETPGKSAALTLDVTASLLEKTALAETAERNRFQHPVSSGSILAEAQRDEPRVADSTQKQLGSNPWSAAVLTLRLRQVTSHRKAKWATGYSASTDIFQNSSARAVNPVLLTLICDTDMP